jgi:hypothetical protein
LGLPYSTKLFEYTTSVGDDLSESETYLTKLGKARKNYISNWSFTPYFFARVNSWYSQNLLEYKIGGHNKFNSLPLLRVLLGGSSSYWHGLYILDNHKALLSTPSNSNVNSPARSS